MDIKKKKIAGEISRTSTFFHGGAELRTLGAETAGEVSRATIST